MPSEGINLRPLVEHFQSVIDELSQLDVSGDDLVTRTKAIRTLEGAREIVHMLCYTGDPDSEYPHLAIPDSAG